MCNARSRRNWSRRRRGAALVEMAIVLPIFVLIAFAMIEASRMCMVAQLLTNAAREGCRVAVSTGKVAADVTTRINATLTSANITPSLVTTLIKPQTATSIETTALNEQITVTLTVPMSRVNWLSTPFFYTNTTVTARAVMLSQRP